MISTDVILDPSKALESIERHPCWAKPLPGISLLHLLLSHLPGLFAAEPFQSISASRLAFMGAELIPILIRNMVAWGFYGLLLYLIVFLVIQDGRNVSYKRLLSLIVYSNIILLVGQILMIVVALIRWTSGATPSFEQTRLINLGMLVPFQLSFLVL